MGKRKKNNDIDWEKIHHLLDEQNAAASPEGMTAEERGLLKEIMEMRAQAGDLKGWEGVNTAEDLIKLKARLSLPETAAPVVPLYHKIMRYAAIILLPLAIAGATWLALKRNSHQLPVAGNYVSRETPAGTTDSLTLADGTKVWLNAASRLDYPAAFTGTAREVTMTGEAYFEVVHNTQQPFIVKVNKQVVRVLGTSFNINAYGKHIITTLTQGKISVGLADQPGTIQYLQPGQQVDLDTLSSTLQLSTGKLENAIAWKEGKIIFTDAPLENIMQQLGAIYHYRVIFINKAPGQLHYNIPLMTRPPDISPLLDLIKATTTSPVNFNIDSLQRVIEIR
ncbi:FecR domain-containing protein [Chitinophaga sp. OAE865]|uniref:FecR family protein n=1 Tax=Chitinophaga sp. OAE865 TaxID=2817898 RepID=UPI001AE22EED